MTVYQGTCQFHGDRLRFDQLEKELRRSKWIPKDYCHRLASAVCSCRKNLDWEPDQLKLSECISYFRTMLETENHDVPSILVTFIKNLIDSVIPTDCSKCRLLNILYLTHKGVFSLLTREAICKNCTESVQAVKPKRRPKPLTQQQYDYIIRKKRKKMDSEVVTLPMFPGNIKKFEAKLGESLADYSKKEGFIYELKHRRNNRCFDDNVNKTYIQIWSNTRAHLYSIKCIFIQKAIEAQRQMEVEKEPIKQANVISMQMAIEAQRQMEVEKERRKLRKAYMKEYYRNESIYDDKNDADDIFGLDRKAHLDKFFKLKMRQDKHTGRRHVGRKQVKIYLGAIRHCLNCHQLYSKQVDSQMCRHHPGFIRSNQWSCCRAIPCSVADLENEHSNSGCIDGEHKWRTHKKANRKPKRNSDVGIGRKMIRIDD